MEGLKFSCKLETVGEEKEPKVNLFKTQEEGTEFLMHLEAEVPVKDKEAEDTKEVELVVVVDRSGSMQGRPWQQVQQALIKVLNLTKDQANIRVNAIAYNQGTEILNLSGKLDKDTAMIEKIRASGSTSFCAVFTELTAMFQSRAKDRAFFVFFMTDGLDTCSNPREIMAGKERMQAVLEKEGVDVVFNVLGFSEDHDDDFLESLTYLGTADGSYSFVGAKEGEKALEERLVQLIESTSKIAGKNLNIKLKGENISFLGDEFEESVDEVVLPAITTTKGGVMKVATKKFVKMTGSKPPLMKVEVYEKLTGNPEPKPASISTVEVVNLATEKEIVEHNLKKMRTAMTMLTSAVTDAESEEARKKSEERFKEIDKKFSNMKLGDEQTSTRRAVESGLQLCRGIFNEKGVSERERALKSKACFTAYNMASFQPQNQRQVQKKGGSSNMWLGAAKGKRSKLQTSVKNTDYTLDDFAME